MRKHDSTLHGVPPREATASGAPRPRVSERVVVGQRVSVEPDAPSTGVKPAARLDDPLTLARAAASGHRGAQRHLFAQLRRPVHATVYRILGSNRYAEDLVQEAFIEIFRSIHGFEGKAKLTTWADRITVRVIYRHLRRPELVLTHDGDAAPPSLPPLAEQRTLAREGLRHLHGLMAELSPEQRVAYTLFEIDGRSLREIADVTEVSLVTAKSRVWRARRFIQSKAKTDPVLRTFLHELKEAP